MRQPMFVLLLFGVCAASPAFAGTLVIGAGLGRECYEQTLSQPNPMRNIAALQICDKAVEDHSVNTYNRAAALVNRADILLRMGRFPEAISDSETAIALDPNIGAAHLNRGAGLIGLQHYDEALASLNRAVDLGELQLAYFDRGMAKEYLGDARGAYYDYRKAAELDPSFQLASNQLSRFTIKTQ
jgi:tetratricopeptide (TPR) repeat protein